ncbi:MAG: recN [Burkholderiales bacterium]|jgi:DNA repair protein RecN (Recombination protein N)|nr:recN [Burkholderiales bacterium]
MLVQLKISNYLLIEKLELDFYLGLTVVTGETGSGKSIIIDALMLIFGARANRDIVRTGAQAANFEATFLLSNQNAISWLQENALLDLDNPDSVICRRTVDNQGKSKIQINGHGVTALQIRTLGDYMLDIHTQHASITLLKADTQRSLLDQFCAITIEVDKLGVLYKQIQELSTKLNLATTAMHDLEIKREVLSEKITELSALNLHAGEWEQLQEEHKQLNNAGEVLSELDYALRLLNGSEESMLNTIGNLHTHLNKIINYIPRLEQPLKIVDSLDIEIRELSHELNLLAQDITQDPIRLAEIESRMEEIFSLSRKYRLDPTILQETLANFEQELSRLNQDSDIAQIEQELLVAKAKYNDLAASISKKRAAGANKLAKEVTGLLRPLAISGQFNISLISSVKPTAYGLESIEYQVCFNQGMPLQSLTNAASGGELSRVALALYLLLSINNPPEVIIFDEIDVGIGGKVAAVVGQMLAQLGTSKQVICITHQPQAASFGTNHLVVSKTINKTTTITHVNYVKDDARIAEVARMLGGVHITDATLVHAKEMLTQHIV